MRDIDVRRQVRERAVRAADALTAAMLEYAQATQEDRWLNGDTDPAEPTMGTGEFMEGLIARLTPGPTQ